MAQRAALKFKITLLDIEPPIWRRIQISDLCTFWDLHVAIQDAIGWKDCHLHQFQATNPETGEKKFFGIPDNSGDGIHNTLPGWDHKIKDYLENNKKFMYEYDFGDGWRHSIECEGTHDENQNRTYPICLDGERAGPPEDVGGVPGYYRFLEIIRNPDDEDHEFMLTWVGGSYDPDVFDASKIKFDNPEKRLKKVV